MRNDYAIHKSLTDQVRGMKDRLFERMRKRKNINNTKECDFNGSWKNFDDWFLFQDESDIKKYQNLTTKSQMDCCDFEKEIVEDNRKHCVGRDHCQINNEKFSGRTKNDFYKNKRSLSC